MKSSHPQSQHLPFGRLSSMLFLSSVTFFYGCRIEVPNPEEQAELVKGGYVPGSSAPWMSPGAGMSNASALGVIPDTFDYSIGSKGPSIAAYLEAEEQLKEEGRFNEHRAKLETEKKPDSGPIGRIEADCPGIESKVSAAITSTELADRISKYEQLTRDCSRSVDLWYWLGQDYYKAGRSADAVRALNQALVIEPTNKAASDLLREVNRPRAVSPGE